MFETILAEIASASKIIIHRHEKPDGDALGSQIGLAWLIRENYPEKKVFCVGDEAGRYAFIKYSEMEQVSDEQYRDALAVILDCGAASLISDKRYETAKHTVRIDHHVFGEKIAESEVIDPSFESCAGLVVAMAEEAGWAFSPRSAEALYTGMVTDSGRFRYDCTSARTLALASKLLEQPFSISELYGHLYEGDLASLQLRAKMILKIQKAKNGVAFIYSTKEEVRAYGFDEFTISRGMVNVMADIAGIETWVNFTETDKGVLCELRSNQYDVNEVAVRFGGGGHKKASGATVASREEAMAMVRELEDLAVVTDGQ